MKIQENSPLNKKIQHFTCAELCYTVFTETNGGHKNPYKCQ